MAMALAILVYDKLSACRSQPDNLRGCRTRCGAGPKRIWFLRRLSRWEK